MNISIKDDDVLAALRSFLLSILPSDVEVIAGQDNGVPEPLTHNFVVMTPILRTRTETSIETIDSVNQLLTVMQPTQITVQLDIHGPQSADNAQVITTLFRNGYAVDSLEASGFELAPLYCGDARQSPFINAESQYENRYIIDAVMQINPSVVVPQDSATSLNVSVINVDDTYHP